MRYCFLLLMLSSVYGMISGCGKKAADESQEVEAVAETAEVIQTTTIEPLTNDVVLRLFAGMPDHYYNEGTAKATTPEFYKLIVLGFDAPSDAPGGIGSEEWLWYWVTGQEEDLDATIKVVKITQSENAPTQASAIVSRTDYGDTKKFEMQLVAMPDPDDENQLVWRVEDFDGNKAKLIKYIDDQYELFKKDGGRDLWKEQMEDQGCGSPEEKAEYLHQVSLWLKAVKTQFPEGIAK